MQIIMDISFVSDCWSHARNPEGFRADQASGSQQPPPPPPNLAEVMASADRTSQPPGTSTAEPTAPAIMRRS
jgi:hypothetical protein